MWNFNASIWLVILGGLALSWLGWIKQLGFRVLMLGWLVAVTLGACFMGGVSSWPKPALPEVRLAAGTLACLVEDVADGSSSLLIWDVETLPNGLRFALRWNLDCPRSKLMAIDRKW